MEILYLLVPLSVVLVLIILAGLWWAIEKGQSHTLNEESSGRIDANQLAFAL